MENNMLSIEISNKSRIENYRLDESLYSAEFLTAIVEKLVKFANKSKYLFMEISVIHENTMIALQLNEENQFVKLSVNQNNELEHYTDNIIADLLRFCREPNPIGYSAITLRDFVMAYIDRR